MLTRLVSIGAVSGILVTGAATGFIAQRATGGETHEVHASPTRVAVEASLCPDGTHIGTLHGGDRIYIVGKGAGDDAGWLQIRNPYEPNERWWIKKSYLDVDAATETLPVEKCAVTDDLVAARADTSTATTPGATTTSQGATTSSSSSSTSSSTSSLTSTGPTLPGTPTTKRPNTPTTRPSTTPNNPTTTRRHSTTTTATTDPPIPAPAFGSVKASPTGIWEKYDQSNYSCGHASTSLVTAIVNYATSATLNWRIGQGSTHLIQMSRSGTKFTAQLGPFGVGAQNEQSQTIQVWVTANGPGGTGNSQHIAVTLHDCTFG